MGGRFSCTLISHLFRYIKNTDLAAFIISLFLLWQEVTGMELTLSSHHAGLSACVTVLRDWHCQLRWNHSLRWSVCACHLWACMWSSAYICMYCMHMLICACVRSCMHEHICSCAGAMDVPTCRQPAWSSSRKKSVWPAARNSRPLVLEVRKRMRSVLCSDDSAALSCTKPSP